MFSGVTVVTTLVCYLHTAHEAADAPSVRHSLRPLLSEGQYSCIARAHRAAGMQICILTSLRGAKATKQSILSRCDSWIASRSLSSGAHSRDPLARNDDRNV
jgi:hypothetical protein